MKHLISLLILVVLFSGLNAKAQTSIVWVSRNQSGGISAVFANSQPGYAIEQLLATDPAVVTFLASPTILPTSLALVSASSPALNGSYAFDAATQAKMLPVAAYISTYQTLPAGAATMQWPDTSGAMHTFTASQFAALSRALADYGFLLAQGQTPASPVTIP